MFVSNLSFLETQMEELVYVLASSPGFVQDKILFAARPSGLYQSKDGGLTWQASYTSLNLSEPIPTTTVALSPDFTNDRTLFAGSSGGILRSTNGGQTWQIAMLPPPPPVVSTIVVSPNFTQDGVLLAGTMEDGIFRSADRGSRWVVWNFGLLDLHVLSLVISPDFAQDEILYAGTDSGIFRSTNGGRAWREVNSPFDFEPVLSLAISPNYTQDGTLFAGTEAHGLFCSTDEGESWLRLGEEAIPNTVNGIILSPQFPDKPDILVSLSQTLLISRDGGQAWSEWRTGWHAEQGIASITAPRGLDPTAPVYVGLVSGGVVQIGSLP
jgi:photosystem II stability/assembly factor-like uncharacterized protein